MDYVVSADLSDKEYRIWWIIYQGFTANIPIILPIQLHSIRDPTKKNTNIKIRQGKAS